MCASAVGLTTCGSPWITLLQDTISGSGWLEWEKRRFRIEAGETMLLTIPHDHRYWVENGGRWKFFWISMSGEEALRGHHRVGAGPQAQSVDGRAAGVLCLRILEDSGNAPGALSALAYEATMALSDEISKQANNRAKARMRSGAQSSKSETIWVDGCRSANLPKFPGIRAPISRENLRMVREKRGGW
jgi:hypothetical protein